MDFINEEDDFPVALGDLVDDCLQALLKLTLVFRSGHQRAHVERENLLCPQVFRHVSAHYSLGQPLGDRCLSGSRLADEHRVVLGASAQDLQYTANLVVASDHRVELAASRAFVEVDGILVERIIGVFCALVCGFFPLAQLVNRAFQLFLAQASVFEDCRCRGACLEERQ